MQPLGYTRARSVGDALALAADGATLLAGGTELLNWLRIGVAAPSRLVDVGALPELGVMDPLPRGGLRIGAAVTLAAVAADRRVAARWPVLRDAIRQAASAQIRNRATIGGNLLQRPRCPSFRAEGGAVPCNRRSPGSGCSALASPGATHAILGWTETCVATHPSDPAVAVAAIDARILLEGPAGRRVVDASAFHLAPDGSTAGSPLAAGELVVAIDLPAPAPASAYVKVRGRASYEFATVSAAATVELDGDVLGRARLALGSVAPGPWRLPAAEAALAGAPMADAAAAIDAALAVARPFPTNAYKVTLARNAALRALRLAAGGGERP